MARSDFFGMAHAKPECTTAAVSEVMHCCNKTPLNVGARLFWIACAMEGRAWHGCKPRQRLAAGRVLPGAFNASAKQTRKAARQTAHPDSSLLRMLLGAALPLPLSRACSWCSAVAAWA